MSRFRFTLSQFFFYSSLYETVNIQMRWLVYYPEEQTVMLEKITAGDKQEDYFLYFYEEL